MRKTLFSILFCSLLCAMAAAQPLRNSEIRAESVHSDILGEDVMVNVYLPAGYDASESRLYPAVYLLHGLYGTYKDWASAGHMKEVVDELIISGEVKPLIIIMPNAGDPDVHNKWNGYFNVPGHNYESFFFEELIPAMEKNHKVAGDKGHRAVMGLSMGGGGSTVYSQRHPEAFSSCYAMSAWLDNNDPHSDNPNDKLYIVSKSVREHSAIDFVTKADDATIEKLRTVKWFFDCGDDDFLMDLSVKLYQEMRNRRIKAELRVRDGWHSWEYWHQALRLALPFASRNFDN